MMISSTTPSLMEMSILMVGEMLARLPSSKVSGGRNGIVEPIDRPGWDKIFGFNCVNGVLVRRHEGFLWKEECTMM
jgi:hypothetical protein